MTQTTRRRTNRPEKCIGCVDLCNRDGGCVESECMGDESDFGDMPFSGIIAVEPIILDRDVSAAAKIYYLIQFSNFRRYPKATEVFRFDIAAEYFGVSEETVAHWFNELVENGYVESGWYYGQF